MPHEAIHSYMFTKVIKCLRSLSVSLCQWIISELACYTYSMVVVPLYDTLGPDAIRYIINKGKGSHVHNVFCFHAVNYMGFIQLLCEVL